MASLQTLIDMGFAESKVLEALKLNNNNVEQAMEFLLTTSEGVPTTSTVQEQQNVTDDKEKTEENEAKSIKCDECQKLFRTSDEVEFHAVKSGHSAFSESTEEKKALTEEEKKEKLRLIEEKIKERRKLKEQEERKEAVEKEKLRIKQSKEYSDVKKRTEEMEIKKLVEERRREKMEDKLARQKVKDQIESDRKARKEREIMLVGGASTAASPPPQAPPIQQPSQKKEYDTARLQIRLPTGPPLVQNFGAHEPLSAVRLWISLNRKDGFASDVPFKLSTTFPRKIFSDEDMEKPLSALGLLPSAVLAVTK